MKQIASSKRRYARLGLAAALSAVCLGTAGVAAAQTTNNIYGNFRWSLNHADSNEIDSSIRGDNNTSRLGVRGEMKGNALTAFYHVEGGLQNDGTGAASADDSGTGFSSRYFYAGVKGDFGSVTVGRHSVAYKLAGTALNPFQDTGVANVTGAYGATGAAYGLSNMSNGFANNALAYVTPKLGPVNVNAAVYLDDEETNDHDYAAGISFAEGPVVVGFQYFDGDNGGYANAADTKAYRVHASFSTGPVKLGASAELLDFGSTSPAISPTGISPNGDDVKYYFLAATYRVAPITRISASFGMVDEGRDEGIGYNLGVFHDVLPNTTVYGLYSKADLDNRDDTDVFALGLVYNFSMSL